MALFSNEKEVIRFNIKRFRPIILCIIFISSVTHAAVYYLDAVHGNDSASGSSSNPWKTLDKAQSVAQAGDIIKLRDGYYGPFIEEYRSRDRSDWITYMADDGHTPRLNYIFLSNEMYGANRSYYLKFDGLTVQANPPSPLPPDDGYRHFDYRALVYLYETDHVIVQNCRLIGWNKYCTPGTKVMRCSHVSLIHNEQSTTTGGVHGEGTHYLTISGNYIHNMGEGSGLRIVDNPLTGEPSTNTLWEDNHLYDMGGSASADDPYFPWQPDVQPDYHQGSFFAVKCKDVTIRRNIAHYGGSQGLYFYTGQTYSNMIVENNLIYDTGGRVDFDPTSSIDYRYYTGRNALQQIDGSCIVRNNTFIGDVIVDGTGKYDVLSRYCGDVFTVSFASGYDGRDVEIYNNIIVGQWGLPDPYDASVNQYKEDYNIFWGQRGNNGTRYCLGQNTFFAVWRLGYPTYALQGYPNLFEHVGNVSTDQYSYDDDGVQPFFINPNFYTSYARDFAYHGSTGLDYRLAAGSFGINFGDPAHQPSDSLGTLGADGFIRNDGPARNTYRHSVGCYEYAETPTDTTAPSQPQNLQGQAKSDTEISLSWTASTDEQSGIAYYCIYRNGQLIGQSAQTTYTDTGLTSDTTYRYQVSAINGASLESTKSSSVDITTSSVPPTDPVEVIIDNTDASTASGGTWEISGASNCWGTNSLWSRTDGGYFRFSAALVAGTTYAVYEWHTEWPSRVTDAPYQIRDGGTLVDTVYVNQQINGGQWNFIGTYTFDSTARVTILATPGSDNSTNADAIRFVPLSATLTDLEITGPTTVSENSTTDYDAVAYYSDGTYETVNPQSWSVDTIEASIDSTGVLSTGPVDSDISAAITAQYTVGNITMDDIHTITISDNPSAEEIIVDNTDSSDTSYAGAWDVSGASGFWASDSLWSRTDGGYFTFSANVAAGTTYAVYEWHTEWSSRVTDAPYLIRDGGTLVDTVYVNQQVNGGQWNLVGTYTFNNTASVTILATPGSDNSTCADAIRFVPVSITPVNVIVDNRDVNTVSSGNWDVSGASGYWATDSVWSRTDGGYFRFNADLAAGTTYDVYEWHTEWPSRVTDAPYQIRSGSTWLDTVYVNQQINGGQWNLIGTFTFNDTASVTIVATPGSSYSTNADAVAFIPVSN